jgi:hypothetical protein
MLLTSALDPLLYPAAAVPATLRVVNWETFVCRTALAGIRNITSRTYTAVQIRHTPTTLARINVVLRSVSTLQTWANGCDANSHLQRMRLMSASTTVTTRRIMSGLARIPRTATRLFKHSISVHNATMIR